ncbi:hypothetical protein POM88_010638 [Heracleum sosnowskyi]|uniref:RNase H type-1 domain-containing protein n=1 Tax=Heracleum sosnowskyi TaxID=360622 RepID=A0AAD8IT10_9APIA|nr:hypothetical protein POM88_010638 [Heracleum sosnowskyi]
MVSILRPNKVSQIGVYNNHRGFCGFIDGSWRRATDQGSSCGVGGYLQDIYGNLLFFFSGPSIASCALVYEYNALFFLLKSNGDSPLMHKKFTIFSDCQELVDSINCLKITLQVPWFADSSFMDLIHLVNFDFVKIHRDLNSKADSLARQGVQLGNMFSTWC